METKRQRLDLTMPHLTGEECFRELLRLENDLRVIPSSGRGEQEITRRFAGKGIRGLGRVSSPSQA